MAQEKTKQRKILAVLAGGLVLGVGAAVTLAAWNDSEFATGEFSAGTFNLEGSETSATAGYADHEVAPGAPLQFTLPLADNLSPTDTVYAPLWLRLDATTTSPASLTATAIAGSGANASNLSYTVNAIGVTETCDATTATTGIAVASGGDLETLTAGSEVDLAVGAGGEAGEAAQLCFAVTAGADLVEGETATATWSFTATSE